MSVSEPFIRRPVATTLLAIALVLAGVLGWLRLPVSNLPTVDFPTLQVSANLTGASPETMASSVAAPLERQFTTIAGLSSMSSSSSLGQTQITLQFELDRDIDAAAQDVQAAISAAGRRLPEGMSQPPTFRKVNPADQPVILLAVTSATLPLSQVNEYAETLITQRLSTVPGVSQVNVYGAQKYAVRAQMDPALLASRGLALGDVEAAMRRANVNVPTGTLHGQFQAYDVQAQGQLTQAAEYRDLVVAMRDGAPVRLGDLGRVVDSVENDKSAAWFNRVRGVVLAVQRQPGSNTIAVVDGVRDALKPLAASLPAAVKVQVLYDRSTSIRASVHDVEATLWFTMVLVVLVIFLFLRDVSATVIPALALPTSIVATFGVMALLGYSLDNLSLMALTLATGFVVDDAIVMLENIVRHVEAGRDRFTAALVGAREIGFTIVAMTISLVAVFLPVLFMGGVVGRLFTEFAVTISVAIVVSGLVSLTLTPMLASRFLRTERHDGRFSRAIERGFVATRDLYDRTLRGVLARRGVALGAFVALAVLAGGLFTVVPKGFLPTEDAGQLMISSQAQQGVSFEDMVRHQQVAADIVAKDPDVQGFMSNVTAGGGFRGGGTSGMMFVSLKPLRERRSSAEQVARRLREPLAQIPGLKTFLNVPPAIRLGGMNTRSSYQVTVQGLDTPTLMRGAQALETRLAGAPGLVGVNSNLEARAPQLVVSLDRDAAAARGVTAEAILTTLGGAYGARQVSEIFTPTNDYQVILEVLPEAQRSPEALHGLYVRATTGALVPLDAVTHVREGVGPVAVNHVGLLPAVTLSFNLAPGTSLDAATQTVQAAAGEVLPEGVTAAFAGTAQVFQESTQHMGLLLVVSVLVIYLVLGVLYESFVHPLTVLAGLPSAGLGALLTLLLFGRELDVYGFVGLVMLVGIVKKNAIILIDFALEAEREGLAAADAIYQACLVRFRPIMMTTAAALMGTLPLALGLGAGGEARQSLGLAVVGGLLVSQLLTLYVTPVVFLYLDGWRQKPAAAIAAESPRDAERIAG